MDASPIPIDTLLAHREWVRSVARAVVRDPNAADDVEQETWLAALRTPPRDASSLRGWFGAVTRSRARRIGRTDSRRELREAVVARGERTASAAELAELADTHRRVVAAVVELDEPYRETILLRYFEGLSIEDVAVRMSAPLETTRSRVKRGVAKLRERLERELGVKGRPWHLALVPLIGGSRETGIGAGIGAVARGGLVMAATTKTALVVAGVLLLLGAGAVVVPMWTSDKEKVVADVPADEPARPSLPPAKRVPETVHNAAPRPRPAPEPVPPEETKPAAPGKPAAPKETVRERLEKVKLRVDWNEAKLVDVFAELSVRTKVDIVISAEAAESWGNVIKLVSLRLEQEVKADQILGLVTQLKGVEWVVEEPRIVIVPMGVKRDPSKPVIVPPPWTPPQSLTVIGRVVNSTGAAVPGAEVVRIINDDERVVATADIAGRFEVKLTKPFGELEARAAGHVSSYPVAVEGQPGAQVTLDLATRGDPGTLVVRLISDAQPIPVLSVTIWCQVPARLPDGRPAAQRERTQSSEGRAEVTFSGLTSGLTRVLIRSEKYEADPKMITVVAGKTVELEVRLVAKLSVEETLAKKRVSLNAEGLHLNDVVHYLNESLSLSILVSPALMETFGQRTITMSVKDRPVDETLRELCREIGGATYVIQGPVIVLTPEKR